MKISQVRIEPNKPKLGDLLKVTAEMHNDSQDTVTATVNAVLGSQDPSFPASVRQYRISLEADSEEDLMLFELMVNKRFLPGQYRVEVWLAGPDSGAKEATFEVEKDADFKHTF